MPLFGPFARLGDAMPRYRFGSDAPFTASPARGGEPDFYGGWGDFRDYLRRPIRGPKFPGWPPGVPPGGGPPNLWGDAGPPIPDAPPIRLPELATAARHLSGGLPLFPPLGPQTTRRTQLFGPLALL